MNSGRVQEVIESLVVNLCSMHHSTTAQIIEEWKRTEPRRQHTRIHSRQV
jgi:hypothetical protein